MTTMARHHILGKKGEDKAVEYLERRGYTILDRNWRVGHLELDIVCRHGGMLVIVEVKTRRLGEENVVDLLGWQKRRNLIKAADAYVKKKGWASEIRFDLICLSGEDLEIEHIKEAISIID